MGFKLDAKSLVNGISKVESKADKAITMWAETAALNMEADAKSQARWTDRTGAARRSLKGDTSKIKSGIRVRLSLAVPYGTFLEFAMEKRFAIVTPIIEISAPFIMDDFEKFIERL